MAGRIVSSGLGVIVAALLSRYLGVEGFGVYALLISYGTLLQVVADFGLYLSVTRELPVLDVAARQHLLASASGLRVALALLVFGAGFLIALFFPRYQQELVPFVVVAVAFLFQSLSQLLMGVYQAYGSMWRAAIGDFVGRVIQLLVVAVLITVPGVFVVGSEVLAAAIAFVVSAGVAYGVHGYLVPQLSAWRFTVSLSKWKSLVSVSWPLAVLLVLSAIYFRIDMVMLSWYRSEAEVGWYALAYRIIESLLFIPAAFGGLLLPRLSELTSDIKQVKKLISQALHVLFVVGAGLVALLTAGGERVSVFLSGAEFAASGAILIILSGALLVMFFGNLFGFVLVSQKRQRSLLFLYGALVVFNVVANVLFIPRYGASAAAWTTVATELLATVCAGVLVYRAHPFSMSFFVFVRIALLAVLTFFVVSIMLSHVHVLLALGVAGILYVAGVMGMGLHDRRFISLLLRKTYENV